MRLLVLGGTVFVSRAVAQAAVARGHEVVVACRGVSGSLPDGVRHVQFDRAHDEPPVAQVGPVDAVVDVARTPSWVRTAVRAWPQAHWVFVSTVNVYPDDAMTPGGSAADTPLREPQPEDVDLAADPEAYGRMKVACEQLVVEHARSASVVRPGLVAGPGDPSGRFSYWPARLADAADGADGADGEPVLAGGRPADLVQLVDARDLAAWLVALAEQRRAGRWDAVGPATPIGDLLAEVGSAVGAAGAVGAVGARLTWLSDDRLAEAGVEPWMGPDSLPLWLPRPEHDAMMTRDHRPAAEAGLRTRPVGETARDVLAWLRATPDAATTGLSRTQERRVLAAARE